MMLLAANSTIYRYYIVERKKQKLRCIAIRTYKSCIRHGDEYIMPKG